MAEIDPLVLELVAKNQRYLADMRSTTASVDQMLGRQEASVRKLEMEMQRATGSIGSAFKGLAATLATAFTGRELVQMLDSFTRYQNALKVAGLQGDELASVQEKLFETAQRNGVAIEAVGTLYGRAAQSSKELGASTQDLLQFTNAVSASLRITGTSTEEASGALLQLGQALGSPRVQAEEFNSLIDTMRPLLVEAAKNIDGTGGSLAGLIAKLKDTKGPGLSNVELFRGITAAMAVLEKTAGQTALTLSARFTTLSNALTTYFGEADKANGVSVALGSAIQALADNLDVIIPSLAIIATAIGSKYVLAAGAAIAANTSLAASATGAATEMGLLGASTFALQARMAGAATTAEALSFAMAGLGRTIPFLAVTALVTGLGYMAVESSNAKAAAANLTASIDGQAASFADVIAKQQRAAAETGNLSAEQTAAITSTANLTGEADKLASAWGRVAAQAKRAAIEQAQAAYSKASLNLIEADDAYNAKRDAAFRGAARRPFAERGLGRDAPALNPQQALAAADQAVAGSEEQRLFRQAISNRKAIRAELERLRNAPLEDFKPAPAAAPSSPAKPSKSTGAGSRDTSADRASRAAELAAQVDDEINRLNVDRLRSVAQLTGSAEDRALADLAALKAERDAFDRGLKLDKELTAAQRRDLKAARDAADAQQDRQIEIERMAGLAREQRAIEAANARLQGEAVQARGQVNDRTAAERYMTDLKLIDLEFADRQQAAEKEYADAVRTGNDVAANIAKAELARLEELRGLAEEAARLRNLSPIEQLREDLNRTRAQIAEDVESVEVRALGNLEDGLVEAIRGAKDLGDVFSNVADQIIADLLRIAIQQTVIKPLADLLGGGEGAGGAGGIGGIIGGVVSLFGSIFGGGRASGGRVNAGTLYRVNEGAGAGRAEFFRPDIGGDVISLGNASKMIAAGQGGGGGPVEITVHVVEGQVFEARVAGIADGRAVRVVQVAQPALTQAAVNETFAQANRKRL